MAGLSGTGRAGGDASAGRSGWNPAGGGVYGQRKRVAGAPPPGLARQDKTHANGGPAESEQRSIPSWVQDYALFLLDVDGRIVGWYSGAERIYGYNADEATGRHVSFLYPGEERSERRAAAGTEPVRGRRPFRQRRLACEKGRDAILGQRHHHGLERRKRRIAGLCESGARLQRASRKGRKVAPQPRARPSGPVGIDHRRHRFRRIRPDSRGQ